MVYIVGIQLGSSSVLLIYSLKNWRLAIIFWLTRITRDMDGTSKTITPEEETIAWHFIKEASHCGNGALLRCQPTTSVGFGHICLNVAGGHT